MALTFEIDRQNANRRSRRWGVRLTAFLNSVEGFTAVVDATIGNAGNPIAATVWGAVKTAMQAASGFETYFDALSKMLMSVGQSAPRYEKYAVLYPTSLSLRRELCNYFSVVINFCKDAVLFVRKPLVSQAFTVLQKPFSDEFGNFQKDLLKFSDAVRDEVSLAAKQQQNTDSVEASHERKESSLFRRTAIRFQRDAAHQLGEIKKWREYTFRSRLLSSLSTYHYETALNQARRKGKSSWRFEEIEYNEWKSSDASSVLLCSGIVGAGKTVISASVVEELVVNKAANASIGYFLCKHDDFESLRGREIMGSLARQLLNGVLTTVQSEIDQDVGDIALNIEQIVSRMLHLLPSKIQNIIVLDGLDECEFKEACQVLDKLQNLLRSPAHVFKLFWTARSDSVARVSRQFQSNLHITISQSNNGPAISSFIEYALDKALESGRLQLGDPHIIVKIQDTLETEARGMFLWVTFQIDSICDENTDEEILRALEDLPKDLPTTYRRILSRLRGSGSTDPVTGKKIFELVAAARRPLTLEELREAISIKPGHTSWNPTQMVNDVMKSLNSCGSLIVVDEELLTVQFAHSSVKQHLETFPEKLDIPEYHLTIDGADSLLGEIIVSYLNIDAFQKQVTHPGKAPQTPGVQDASLLLKAGLPHNTFASNLARKLLENRKTLQYKLGSDPAEVAGFTIQKKVQPQRMNAFLPYALEYLLSHTRSLKFLRSPKAYRLWVRLIDSDTRVVELPWTSQDMRTYSIGFQKWLETDHWSHPATIYNAFEKLQEQGNEGIDGTRRLLLQFRDYHHLTWSDKLISALVDKNASWLEQEAFKEHVFPYGFGFFGDWIHVALACSNIEAFKMLVGRDKKRLLRRDPRFENPGGRFRSVMEAAANSSFAEEAIHLLLEKGAEQISIDEVHGDEAKKALQRGYDLYRREERYQRG